MSEWPMVKLGEYCDVIMGQAPKGIDVNEDLIGLPVIAGAGDFSSIGVEVSKWTEKPTKTCIINDIILSVRATVGTYRFADRDYCLGRGVAALRAKGNLDQKYLSFVIDFYRAKLLSVARGATFLQISKADIETLMIPLPPLGEQKRIAEILGEASKTIKDTEKIIHNVQGVKRSALRGILDNKSGEYVQLSQISSVQSGITKGRKVQNGITLMPTPYMAVSNVKAGYLALSEVKQIDASEAEVNRYQLQAGDILLTEGGDPDKLGRGTIWRNEIPGAIHQNHIFRVRINPDSGFTSEALMAILESTESKGYFLRSAKQTTGISSINKRQLSATPIPVLGKMQIEELTNMWHKIDEVIELYHRKLSLLQELQKSLATRAFAGLL